MAVSKHRLPTPHDAIVLVCDGRKALLFRNVGTPAKPKLHLLQQRDAPPNPPTSAQGADSPGRTSAGQDRRSAFGQTDWHDDAERAFAAELAAGLDDALKAAAAENLTIVAPSRTLGVLRSHLSPHVEALLVSEVAADLTKQTVEAMEDWLAVKDSR